MTGDVAPFLHQLLLACQQVLAQSRARAGMTDTEYAALHHLTHQSDGLTPGQLERSLAITSGSVTKLVDRLEARRLARRIRNPNGDRRSVTVQATQRGKTLIESDLQRLVEHLPQADEAPSRDAREALARLLALVPDRSTRGEAFRTMTPWRGRGGGSSGRGRIAAYGRSPTGRW